MSGTSKKLLVTLIVLNIVIFLCIIFLFFKIQAKSQQAQSVETAMYAEAQNQKDLADMNSLLAKTSTERAKLDDFFLTKEKTVQFLEDLGSYSKKLGVTLHIDSIADNASASSDPSVPTPAPTYSVALSAGGSFSSVLNFLSLVLSLPYKVTLSSFSLQKSGASWAGTFNFTILGENATATATPSPQT